jgi:hypothetical protein
MYVGRNVAGMYVGRYAYMCLCMYVGRGRYHWGGGWPGDWIIYIYIHIIYIVYCILDMIWYKKVQQFAINKVGRGVLSWQK